MSLFEKTFDRAIYLDKEFKIVSQPDDKNFTIELMSDDGLVFEANLSMITLLKIKEEPKEISFTMNKSCSNCKKQNTFMCPVTSFDANIEDFSCNRWVSK